MIKNLFIALFAITVSFAQAQTLVTPSFSVSGSKTSYLTLKNGKEITGNVKSLDRNKGLIEEVKIKDLKGKKHKIDAKDIDFMYLPISGLEKFNQKMDFISDVQQWDDEELKHDLLKDGYAYYESSMVHIKKKTESLMMQLLNPNFSRLVKVYHDPRAKEAASFGIGGMNLVGGEEKSYYIKKGSKPAYKVTKKDYQKEEFATLWGKCGKDFIKTYKDSKVIWANLPLHVIDYSKCMEKE